MISARLIRAIEQHAEDLTSEVMQDLASNPRTVAFRRIAPDELKRRVYDVCRNFGRWLGDSSESAVETAYSALGRARHAEGIPLNELVCALILTKDHIRNFVRRSGLVDSALELHFEAELCLQIGHFFDRAIYHAVKGYEAALTQRTSAA